MPDDHPCSAEPISDRPGSGRPKRKEPHRVASTPMRCPLCATEDTRVIDSRPAEDGAAIRRRRECVVCGERFTTFERSAKGAVVVKRDGRREPFDRKKLRRGLEFALADRPVSIGSISDIVSRIESSARGGSSPVVGSS